MKLATLWYPSSNICCWSSNPKLTIGYLYQVTGNTVRSEHESCTNWYFLASCWLQLILSEYSKKRLSHLFFVAKNFLVQKYKIWDFIGKKISVIFPLDQKLWYLEVWWRYFYLRMYRLTIFMVLWMYSFMCLPIFYMDEENPKIEWYSVQNKNFF